MSMIRSLPKGQTSITKIGNPILSATSKSGLSFASSTFSASPSSSSISLSTASSSGSSSSSSSFNSREKNFSSHQKKLFTVAVAGGALASLLLAQDAEAAEPGKTNEAVDFAAVRKEIVKLLDEDDNRGPTFVRLAWHASGTYDKHSHTGGSSGATMRFQPEAGHGANYGLEVARELLEPIKKAFPDLSYADLWTLASVVSIEYMGGPVIPWRSGRKDAANRTACPPEGRLPDADKGSANATSQHLRDIFYRMGFDDREIVALAGAHSLGRCHVDRSGYSGPWTRSPTTFSNEYFRELVENKWTVKKWDGPEQYEDPTGDLMMLPADIAFVADNKFKVYVDLYAKDQNVFFQDFSKAFSKLLELGVPFSGEKKSSSSWWWWPFGSSK